MGIIFSVSIALYKLTNWYKARIKKHSDIGYGRINRVSDILPVKIKAKNSPNAMKFLSGFIRFNNLYIKKNDKAKNIKLR